MGQSEETEGAEFTPEQAKIVETLRGMQSEIADVKAELMAKLSESRKECDSLYRELSKVRDELITSKTERRVLSRWYEDVKAERDKLHGELVDVRSALAAATEERDSLRTTLESWEQADTKPHKRVAADDVADHVVPPILHVGEPDPANNAKDAALEFRNVVPTPEMIKHVGYWDLVSGAAAIAFKPGGLRLVFWRISGSQEWRTDPCPQPLRPHGMTWQQLDKLLVKAPHNVADHVVPPVLPLCNVCHECRGPLISGTVVGSPSVLHCRNERCLRRNTAWRDDVSPYYGSCKSTTPVRHE